MIDLRIDVGVEAIFVRRRAVSGRDRLVSVSVIRTIDLMPFEPYFHSTTSRTGAAPFWLGSGLPYMPSDRMVSGFSASWS